MATPIFDHDQPINFRSTFNFYEFVSTCKKWGCFIDLFWENTWFKNPVIWLAESILVYTRFLYKQHFLSTQPQCCLTFSLIQLQMLLSSCLLYITIIILRHFIFSKFASMSWLSSIYVVCTWSIFHFQPFSL